MTGPGGKKLKFTISGGKWFFDVYHNFNELLRAIKVNLFTRIIFLVHIFEKDVCARSQCIFNVLSNETKENTPKYIDCLRSYLNGIIFDGSFALSDL